jgi:hypothetical protein
MLFWMKEILSIVIRNCGDKIQNYFHCQSLIGLDADDTVLFSLDAHHIRNNDHKDCLPYCLDATRGHYRTIS